MKAHQSQIFAKRRQRLMAAMPPNSIAILVAAPERERNWDNLYPYRQNSNFYYLTGFAEPEAVALLLPGRPEGEFVLFNRQRHAIAEIWDGKRAGQEGAVKEYGVDQAFPIEELNERMPALLSGHQRIYCVLGKDAAFDQQLTCWINKLQRQVRAGISTPTELVNIEALLHEMRLIKSPEEVELMRKAGQISAQAHCQAMRVCRPGMMEYELEAELLHEFIRHGARTSAYNSIVGSGANTCVLHYITNNQQIQDGDLVLIDAGAEYEYYAADITRTFPANGRFTKEQQAIYELVLATQQATIAFIKPGVSWERVQELPCKLLTEGLVELGILKGKIDDLLEQKAYRQFYMHNIGHWLGLDTHDVGEYRLGKEWRKLETGIVMTVEPGIYIRPAENVDAKWWNIGVRIEDNILLTATGNDVLTAAIPKTVAEVQALVGSSVKK